jgi:hypothetical protein
VGEVMPMMQSFQKMFDAIASILNQEVSGASIIGDGPTNHHNVNRQRELKKMKFP